MRKSEKIIETMEKEGYKFITFSSIWNVYGSNIGKSKNSNIYKDSKKYIDDGRKVVAVIGAKGWSQHSKSEVLLFEAAKSHYFNPYFNIYELN